MKEVPAVSVNLASIPFSYYNDKQLLYASKLPNTEMEEIPMSNITKRALVESLKKLLLKKPLTKITINDLTTDCGISRMAFYYHFKDIYDLVEWACLEESRKALQGKKTYATWQEGLLQIFEAVYENKPSYNVKP